jgi:mannose-6-phosphate isomerase-like protein (cupin superfamily)
MMTRPLVSIPTAPGTGGLPLAASGASFSVMEWRGSGPRNLHIHHADDEAWHVLEGTLRFRFTDGEMDVPAGGTVYVPAGVPHTYVAQDARYLIVLTPRLAADRGAPGRAGRDGLRRHLPPLPVHPDRVSYCRRQSTAWYCPFDALL